MVTLAPLGKLDRSPGRQHTTEEGVYWERQATHEALATVQLPCEGMEASQGSRAESLMYAPEVGSLQLEINSVTMEIIGKRNKRGRNVAVTVKSHNQAGMR